MKLTFELTPDELAHLSMEVNKESGYYKNMAVKHLVVLIFTLGVLCFSFYLSSADIVMPITMVITSLLLLPFYPSLRNRILFRAFKKFFSTPEAKIYLEKQSLVLSKKGLKGVTSKIEVSYPWTSVLKLIEDQAYFIIYLEGARGWLIPKKIFKKGEQTEFKKWFKSVNSK